MLVVKSELWESRAATDGPLTRKDPCRVGRSPGGDQGAGAHAGRARTCVLHLYRFL